MLFLQIRVCFHSWVNPELFKNSGSLNFPYLEEEVSCSLWKIRNQFLLLSSQYWDILIHFNSGLYCFFNDVRFPLRDCVGSSEGVNFLPKRVCLLKSYSLLFSRTVSILWRQTLLITLFTFIGLVPQPYVGSKTQIFYWYLPYSLLSSCPVNGSLKEEGRGWWNSFFLLLSRSGWDPDELLKSFFWT